MTGFPGDPAIHDVNNNLFQLLLEFEDYAIIRIDCSGFEISWNPGAEHIFGYESQRITGKHISELPTDDAVLNTVHNPDQSSTGFAMVTRDTAAQKRLEEENRRLHEEPEEKVRLRTSERATVNKEHYEL